MKDKNINWVNLVLNQLSKLKDDKGIEILNKCGEKCSKTSELLAGAVKINKKYANEENADIIFNAYKTQYYNSSRLTKRGNAITLIFDTCTCPLVEEGVSNAYLCNCTIGYTKNVFETLFNREVNVDLKRSILRGDKQCEQLIIL